MVGGGRAGNYGCGKAARRELTAHAADLAVALANKQILVDAATDQSLVRSFARELGRFATNPERIGTSRGLRREHVRPGFRRVVVDVKHLKQAGPSLRGCAHWGPTGRRARS